MSETKPHPFKPPLYRGDGSQGGDEGGHSSRPAGNAGEDKGWDAYRKWLSTVSKRDQSNRPAIDRSIYSWKGYHSWADRVKQAWKYDDEG